MRVAAKPNYYAGPADLSESVVQRGARVETSAGFVSPAFRDIPSTVPSAPPVMHKPRRSPFPPAPATQPDPVIQALAPAAVLLPTLQNFLGQGTTLGGCIYPRPDMGEPSGCTSTGDPPDTNGVVGRNHYVQLVNGGIAIWSKAGDLLMGPKLLNTLWAGYVGTNSGNACATQNDGDPVVLYDALADRWFVTQFSLPNYDANKGPSFQCVAVSQTGDPTGAYNLYDFQYSAVINDYGKFGVWNDAYYATFNNFTATSSQGANVCAYDRAAMLQGKPATQQCFQQSNKTFSLMPASIDGLVKPPNGEPEFFVTLRSATALGLYKFHVDWTTPANSTFTGPTNLPVASYTQLCATSSCVAQPAPGNNLDSLGDRAMFHLSYRNFGTVESLVFNHSVVSGSAGSPRWYEIRSPNGTPSVFQQATFAPGDGNYRWMGSMSQDQAQDIALGYSISGSAMAPSIAWTGRTATDPAGTMGQGETIVSTGVGVQSGTFSDGTTADRWGDYSNMSIDPVDDCTFWYTQELYPANGIFNWDTRIASLKFPNCALNDFSIGVSPALGSVAPGTQVSYTVTTTSTKGTAETIALTVQDLPTGLTGAFNPTSVTAGNSATLTLTAAANAPLTGAPSPTFMVIGKAASALHAATAQVAVASCVPATQCAGGANCGTIADGCGGTVTCGPACAAPNTCGGGGAANVCGCAPTVTTCPNGANCGTIDNGCGVAISCGAACATPTTCGGGGTSNVCGCTPTTCAAQQAECGAIADGCGNMLTCTSTCTADQSCVANKCRTTPADMSVAMDMAVAAADLASGGSDLASGGSDLASGGSDLATSSANDLGQTAPDLGGGHGKGSGCGCRIAGQSDPATPLAAVSIMVLLVGALLRRRLLGAHAVS